MKNINYPTCEKAPCLKERKYFTILSKPVLIAFVLLVTVKGLYAQSGGWDATSSNGTTGSFDYGNGVYRLISDVNTGCAGSSISETSSTYDPSGGTDFNQCYQVFFGCPGNDNIGAGTDANGDGMAFSFSKGAFSLVGNSCGGGLGYMNGRADNLMLTIEFDTYSSMGTSGFDANYGGGTSGNHDEISIHINGDASDAGLLEPTPGAGGITDAGNLEDGLEHTICINYNHTTHVLSVTIDGVTKISYDLDLKSKDLATYFGAGGLSQTWSSGKFGATNPATVSHSSAQSITSQLGGVPLCPSAVDITSPSDGSVFSGCPLGPITITATATPPAGNTVTSVDFFVDGVNVGNDASFPYSVNYSPTNGSHVITATAHFSGGSSVSTISNTNITVGGINKTSTVPTIDGNIDAVWGSYPSFTLTKGFNSAPSLAASYKIMYDASRIYVLVDVTDNTLNNPNAADAANYWKNDAVELFLDIGNTKTGTYGGNDYHYALDWNKGSILEANGKSIASISTGQTTKASNLGYITEFSIPWGTLGLGSAPSPGTALGFDVSIDDNASGGSRTNQLDWNDPSFNAWNNPSKFGTLQFTNCDPLPVTLLNFTGKSSMGTVVLRWVTEVEINNQKFIIERSNNTSDWEAIGEVAGAGNVTTLSNYSFTDYSPLDGMSYYRLRQVDKNGAVAYSAVVTIQADSEQSVSISPNPFEDALIIKSTIKGELDISISDVLGKLLYHVTEKNDSGTLRILQPDLASGSYIVTVQAGGFVEHKKVIKK
jgi:hypothetical protein